LNVRLGRGRSEEGKDIDSEAVSELGIDLSVRIATHDNNVILESATRPQKHSLDAGVSFQVIRLLHPFVNPLIPSQNPPLPRIRSHLAHISFVRREL